jgi:putative membrane protein
LVAFVSFTLYGIEGIAQTYEDPFGVAKIDINMDDVVEDTRQEVECLMSAWQGQGQNSAGLFRPRFADIPTADDSSGYESGEARQREDSRSRSKVRFAVNDLSEGSYTDGAPLEIARGKGSKLAASPGAGSSLGGNVFFATP